MRPALTLKLGQQLTLTPQLKQALRLLTMSAQELHTELSEIVAENPMLEIDEGGEESDRAETLSEAVDSERLELLPADAQFPAGDAQFLSADAQGSHEASQAATGSDAESPDAPSPIEDADSDAVIEDLPLDVDESFLDRFADAPAGESEEGFEAYAEAMPDVRAELLAQLQMDGLARRDLELAEIVLDALDPDGYFRAPYDDLRSSAEPQAGDAELEYVRQRILRLDPAGIAARDLRECLMVQLQVLKTTIGKLALEIVDLHLDLLARGERVKLIKLTGCNEAQLESAIRLIRSLDPKPGSGIELSRTEYVVPDVFVQRKGRQFVVVQNQEASPRLRLNRFYSAMAGKAQRDERQFLKGRMQEARWLIKSLEQREDSVLRVAQAIVETQQAFFEHGPERLRPLVMREVAEMVELHESTVSRVTTRKYLHSARGIFEFKFFFSSGVATMNGDGASASAIQSMIRKLVDDEPPRKPLSDASLETLLKARGVMVARRTVAKYREAMGIPNSNERIRL